MKIEYHAGETMDHWSYQFLPDEYALALEFFAETGIPQPRFSHPRSGVFGAYDGFEPHHAEALKAYVASRLN